MRRIMVICNLLLVICLCAFAQSNLTYELKVGTTGEVKLLQEFPEVYSGEKVNIKVKSERLKVTGDNSESLDFIFANEPQPLAEKFDSTYAYTDEEGVQWAIWRNKKEIKNRGQRVLVANAYKTFEEYVISHQSSALRHQTGWIWWVFAGLLLVGTAMYGCYILYS
ncbi:MAG: hypothetical protein J6S87_07580, partial [Bacteroidales bacterium]|nr:hypothetical protein [Bacteroidales bacterium]